MLHNLKEIAQKEQSYVVAMRNFLHTIPELRWQEEKTLAKLKEEICKIQASSYKKITIKTYEAGLVVDLEADEATERYLFRADMDGLPIEESLDHEPRSKHVNTMHACGHDIHSAMLLSAFKVLASEEVHTKRNLRFVWQRAEENRW